MSAERKNVRCTSTPKHIKRILRNIYVTDIKHNFLDRLGYAMFTLKRRRYFPDFYTKIKTDSGKIKEYVVEIKPKRQVMKPKAKKGITKSYITEANTWMMNQSKWEAAERYCKARNWEFMILTEDDIL